MRLVPTLTPVLLPVKLIIQVLLWHSGHALVGVGAITDCGNASSTYVVLGGVRAILVDPRQHTLGVLIDRYLLIADGRGTTLVRTHYHG